MSDDLLERRRKVAREYDAPRANCVCGHNGDGSGSQHKDSLTAGHGPCRVKGCSCPQFTWSGYTQSFEEALANA